VTTVYGFGADAAHAPVNRLSAPRDLLMNPDHSFYVADAQESVVRFVDSQGHISTAVGSGVVGSRDAAVATEAQLSSPSSLARDSAGVIYISDYSNRVRAYNPSGTALTACGGIAVAPGAVVTIAGTGDFGSSGDGGPALGATMSFPRAMAFHRGKLLIAEIDGLRVRQVDCATGTITTFAGNGTCDDFGAPIYAGDGGPATNAELCFPTALWSDGQTLYIAEWRQLGLIRSVDAAGNIHLVAGTNDPGDDPWNPRDGALALNAHFGNFISGIVGASGALYVTDSNFSAVRKIVLGGNVTTIVGSAGGDCFNSNDIGGPALYGAPDHPSGIAWDGDRLTWAEEFSAVVRSIGPSGELISRTAPDFSPFPALATAPNGKIYIAEDEHNRLFRLEPNGSRTLILNQRDARAPIANNTPAQNATVGGTVMMTTDTGGNVYFADVRTTSIYRIQASKGDVSGASPVSLVYQAGYFTLSMEIAGDDMFVTDPDNGLVHRISLNTGIERKFNAPTDGTPVDLAYDRQNNVLFIAYADVGVRAVNLTTGVVSDVYLRPSPDGPDMPDHSVDTIAFADGMLFINDNTYGEIFRVNTQDPSAQAQRVFGQADPFLAWLCGYHGDDGQLGTNADYGCGMQLAVTARGQLLVTGYGSHRVRRLGSTDIMPDVFPNAITSRTRLFDVAILSSYDFDPTRLDPSTVRVGGAPATVKSTSDIDGDGRADLVVTVDRANMAISANAREIAITAQTRDGQSFVDADRISQH
jgi:hypothetical protein